MAGRGPTVAAQAVSSRFVPDHRRTQLSSAIAESGYSQADEKPLDALKPKVRPWVREVLDYRLREDQQL